MNAAAFESCRYELGASRNSPRRQPARVTQLTRIVANGRNMP